MGSIEDNRLGGWYGYRMAKAALNMGVKTLAIESQRWRRAPIIVAVHPGTTKSNLSKPFTAQRKQLQSAAECGARCYRLIEGLTDTHSGTFLKLDGTQLPW